MLSPNQDPDTVDIERTMLKGAYAEDCGLTMTPANFHALAGSTKAAPASCVLLLPRVASHATFGLTPAVTTRQCRRTGFRANYARKEDNRE
jgi:hypothetical protein